MNSRPSFRRDRVRRLLVTEPLAVSSSQETKSAIMIKALVNKVILCIQSLLGSNNLRNLMPRIMLTCLLLAALLHASGFPTIQFFKFLTVPVSALTRMNVCPLPRMNTPLEEGLDESLTFPVVLSGTAEGASEKGGCTIHAGWCNHLLIFSLPGWPPL